jgi:hypothetical protein
MDPTESPTKRIPGVNKQQRKKAKPKLPNPGFQTSRKSKVAKKPKLPPIFTRSHSKPAKHRESTKTCRCLDDNMSMFGNLSEYQQTTKPQRKHHNM